MPYEIVPAHQDCPASMPFGVISEATGEKMGCHATAADAQAQVDALMMSEPDMGGMMAGMMDASGARSKLRQPITRAVPFTLERATGDQGDGLTLEGYAAVFDQEAEVWDPWDGDYIESFARGAFKKSLKERTPYLMFQHGKDPAFGTLPIGAFRAISEDSKGLHVLARLHDNWLVQPVRDAIASGSIDGMSVKFEPVQDRIQAARGGRPHITRVEAKLYELGPVVMQAYEGTQVSVRSVADLNDLRNLRAQLERERIIVRTHGDEPGATVPDATATTAGLSDEATAGEPAGATTEGTQATPDEGAGETAERSTPLATIAAYRDWINRRFPNAS